YLLTTLTFPLSLHDALPILDQYIEFVYNTSKNAKEVVLDGTYVDVSNTPYSGKVSLSPFSSKVLIKTSDVKAPIEQPNEAPTIRSEEHTTELQSRENVVCRL